MKFICDKHTLTNAIAGVSKAVAAHSNIPILETILFHAEQGRIILTGYDLEMAITTSVPAIVSSPGEIALSAKLIGEGLKGYPNHTNFALDDPRVTRMNGCLVAVMED